MEKWKLVSSKLLLDSPWLRVHENSYRLPEKGTIIPQYFITERRDAALCVCYTGKHFVLVRQYRPAIETFTFCHPGGRLEEGDSSPVSGALRELLEETGYVANEVVSLGTFAQIPAVATSKVHIFLVKCGELPNAQQMLDNSEELEFKLVTYKELNEIIESGEMDCLACVAASYRAFRYLSINIS